MNNIELRKETDMEKLIHAKVTVDNRCLDMLLTEDEIDTGFARAIDPNFKDAIDLENCCTCWPIEKPNSCNFWKRIFGICSECDK
tara:strand:+ start:505 stop:759 length:255 start_codon:yes stop_codon:yes gene_type:complete